MNIRQLNLHEEILAPGFILINDGTQAIGYSLHSSKVFEVFPSGMEALRNYFHKGVDPDNKVSDFLISHDLFRKEFIVKNHSSSDEYQPTHVILSLTTNCNLRCIYCYARAGETTNVMRWETAKSAIDIACKNACLSQAKQFGLSFQGSGEATLIWELLEKCVNYSTELSREHNLTNKYSLVTNATLISKRRAEWLAENNFSVTVSIDGQPDVQNFHRPKAGGKKSFDSAYEGMMQLRKAGVKFVIRATITPHNVKRIDELVDLAVSVGASRVNVEPFSLVGRAKDAIQPVNPGDLLESFLIARQKAQKLGVSLRTSIEPAKKKTHGRFCSADGNIFCVLHDGTVSSCTRITNKDDELAEVFVVGSLSNEELKVYQERVTKLRNLRVSEFSQCANCFAKGYCAGGCHSVRLSFGGTMPLEHCMVAKTLAWLDLLERMRFNNRKEVSER